MKMDITAQFKHYVEIVESDQNKKANKEEFQLDDVDQMLLPDKNRIMPKAKRKKSKNIPNVRELKVTYRHHREREFDAVRHVERKI